MIRLAGVLLAAVLAACLAGATPAAAHSELRSTSPANGAVLQQAPERLDLTFNEKVQVTAVRLFAEGGGELNLPDRRSIRETTAESVRLPSLAPGAWRVDWRAISADGHPIGGTIRFRIVP